MWLIYGNTPRPVRPKFINIAPTNSKKRPTNIAPTPNTKHRSPTQRIKSVSCYLGKTLERWFVFFELDPRSTKLARDGRGTFLLVYKLQGDYDNFNGAFAHFSG